MAFDAEKVTQLVITQSLTGDDHWNVMMWMDHRASSQAQRISHTRHPVLAYVGNTMSLEMQTPKLLWLKEACYHNYIINSLQMLD